LLHLLPYLGKHRLSIAIGVLMVLLTNLAAVAAPWILGAAVGALARQAHHRTLLFYAGLLVAASATEGFFRYQMRRILIGVSRYIEFELRNDVFAHLQTMSPRYFQANPTGDIMSRATNDLSAVRMVLGPGIMYSINTLFTALFAVAMLIKIDATLALLTLVPAAAVVFVMKRFGRLVHDRFEQIQEQLGTLTSLAQENVSGIRVVKAYDQGEAFIRRFGEVNDGYLRKSLALAKVAGLYPPLLGLLLGLSSVGLLWYGGSLVVRGAIGLPHFVAFMGYLAMLTWPTIALGWVMNIVERGSASMARLRTILEAEPDIRDDAPRPITELTGRIEVRGLTFSYGNSTVLDDLHFRIEAGRTVAIVGGTGSGKSTLVNLLCRLQPVPPGAVFFDGVDINGVPLAVLRKHIGFVPQDTFLFSDTVRRNIAFGLPQAPLEAVEQAARVSRIEPDIQGFPDGYETFVGERGITLSGGQKQRMTISRALLINPRILILDDALSSVDTHTEEQILERLADELRGRTAIIISHRISTVKMADHILVLDRGRIVERGAHDELLAAGGYYADLYEKQLLREELGVE
jgi:ATP-binding cassette subfamily B protein